VLLTGDKFEYMVFEGAGVGSPLLVELEDIAFSF